MISNLWRNMVKLGKVWLDYFCWKITIFVSEIQSMGEMEPEFDNETLNLTGKTLRFIMKKTANFGVNNYIRFQIIITYMFISYVHVYLILILRQYDIVNIQCNNHMKSGYCHTLMICFRLQADCDEKWSYHNSFFFAGTLGQGSHFHILMQF